MYPSLHEASVMITGAASGIGRATVERFLAEGARVIAVDRNVAALEEPYHGEQDSVSPAVFRLSADISDAASVDRAVAEGAARFGRIDVLFANAGISRRAPFDSISSVDWRRMLSTNLDGMFFTAAAVARVMRLQNSGVILLMGSTNALRAHEMYCDYNVSKAGVLMLARTMALELAPHIRVNSISPGYVLTPMQRAEYSDEMLEQANRTLPLGRHAEPAEVAAFVAFLSSSEAAYLTGQNYVIDGGENA